MAINQRIRGADVALAITDNGSLAETLTAIDSFGVTFKFEKLVQRYIGEQTVRTDEIFAGCEGKLKFHLYDEAFTGFIQDLQTRAERIDPTIVFNIVATMNFPNGESPVMTFPDLNFGDIPLEAGNAKDYVAMDFDWISSDFDIVA